MIKYLDLFEKDMKKHNADYFVEQIQLYKNMYTHYKNTSCPSPIYTGILNHGDTHCFYFPTNENVNLTWDVDLIYKKFLEASDNMANNELTFNVTGRYMNGSQVVGYQLVG